jgi:predicted acetyltransferase
MRRDNFVNDLSKYNSIYKIKSRENMDTLILVIPNKSHQDKAIKFIQEFIDCNSYLFGTSGIHQYINDYDGWLKKIENELCHNKSDDVPRNTYFAIRKKDNKIIGITNIRHKLNDWYLMKGGHIGLAVRPTERQKGYGTEILFLGLKRCKELGIKKVLMVCDKKNINSAKTIIKNEGIIENEIEDDEIDDISGIKQRYWINTDDLIINTNTVQGN